jgi:uncharacterized protein YndB with AHSA1/START domain
MSEGLTITRTFAAPRGLVYAAWTRPEQFSVWFGTDAVEVPLDTLTMDVRVGGGWTAVMHLPDGTLIPWVGEYTEVDQPAHLAFTLANDPAQPAREIVTVDLVELDDGTRMTMSQTGGNLSEEQYAQTVIGYNGFFDSLERVLTTLD